MRMILMLPDDEINHVEEENDMVIFHTRQSAIETFFPFADIAINSGFPVIGCF